MQFNRRQTVIREDSFIGLARTEDIPLISRFKLSEISNIDQTPIAFEFLSGKTYEFKGAKTVWVKEARSSWDKRQAILQVCVFADGINRCRPLLIFHRAEGKGDSRRIAESRKYSRRVDVLFNPTAWATENNAVVDSTFVSPCLTIWNLWY